MRSLIVCLLVALTASAGELKIGMIGLDTSHVPAMTELINNPQNKKHVPGGKVVAAFKGGSPDLQASASRVDGYTKTLQEKYGVDGVAFPGTAEALAALKNGNCVAFAYDDTAIVGEMQKPEWSAYEMPLDSILFVPWGLAVKQGEKGFADMMSKTATEWHKSGFIQDLEKKWGIKPTKFAQEARDKYK